MNKAEKLVILKKDLQMITAANDYLLEALLDLSADAIKREGIVLEENDIQCDMAVVQYAAWLFRKRGAEDAGMPRYLRWQLNNLLFSQKGRRHDV